MNHNNNFIPPRWQSGCGEGNPMFGYANTNNSRSFIDRIFGSSGFGSNNFTNSIQQPPGGGGLQSLPRQWFDSNQIPLRRLGTMGGNMNAPNNQSANVNTNDSSHFENMHFKMELLRQFESVEYRAKLELRQKLPVMRQKNAILQSIHDHQVVLIVGDKGCGKSSQVPQLLLDDYILDRRGSECRIICSQLTKISALTLAERVACERNESLGKSVGFQIKRESCLPRPNASVLYCTNSVLLRELKRDPMLKGFTICMLDNIDERNTDTNQIMGLLNLLLPKRPNLKIVLLSTNVGEDTFCEFFRNYHVVYIQGTVSVVDLTSDDAPGEELSSEESTGNPTENQETNRAEYSKAAYNKARSFLKKYRLSDPALLTEEQKNRIIFYQQVIESFERSHQPEAIRSERQHSNVNHTESTTQSEVVNSDCFPSTSAAAGVPIKRTISMDEPLLGGKRSRCHDSLEADTDLQVAVIDLSDEKGRMDSDKWLLVEAKLIFDMASEKWSKDAVSFDSVNWYRGIKVITCHNKRSLEFLKIAIDEVTQMWQNANLKVVPRSTIPTYSYATVWIPPPIPPMEQILHLIKKQNSDLNADNWKISPSPKCHLRNFGKDFHLIIDGNSVKYIRERQGRIKFGLGSIRIRIHGY